MSQHAVQKLSDELLNHCHMYGGKLESLCVCVPLIIYLFGIRNRIEKEV